MVEVFSILVAAFLWWSHWSRERERAKARREIRRMMPPSRRKRY